MKHYHHTGNNLTKNQSLVMAKLSESDGPLSAYMLLDQLRDQGLSAPLQIYRALDKLVEFGLVHRIESLNAFVACQHKDCKSHQSVTFMICETCNHVTELTDEKLMKRAAVLGRERQFALQKTTIELRGICAECQNG